MVPHSIRDALTAGTAELERAGVETPQVDATLLLAHVLGQNRTYLYAHLPDPLSETSTDAYAGLIRRRARREPLPYILGTWEFLGMTFQVGPGVLIPRPETEILVEAVAARLPANARILDVGAGSGCISIGLAKLLGEATVTALEPSPDAARIAGRNAVMLGFHGRVRIVEGRFPEDATLGPFEAVVSNPPYIPSREVDELAPELRLHEPRLALDGGVDGLDVLGPLARVSPELLVPGGLLAVEVAQGQSGQVVGLLREAGAWTEAEVISDLGGIPRVILTRLI